MNVHVLQHVPFEDIGSMAPWLSAQGARLSYTRFYENAALPDPAAADLVIAMGGPMSVNDEARLPWLREEKRFIRKTVESGKPFIGICLGAQLLASAFGARVTRNREREIGWHPVESVSPHDGRAFRFPARETVFHWHGETFDLPDGAVRLARSAACLNQAFQLGHRALGLQFHLETTPHSAAALVEACRDELTGGAYVQSEASLMAVPEAAYARINRLMEDVLAFLTRA